MFCEKCGREYDGNECPNCAFENRTQNGPLNNQADDSQTTVHTENNTETVRTSGVHSDTIYRPWGASVPGGGSSSSAFGQTAEHRCGYCGAAIREGAQFCGQCGAKVTPQNTRGSWHQNLEQETNKVQVCPSCGAVIVDGGQFCAQCGTPVNPVGTAAPQDTYMGSGNQFTDNYLYALQNDRTGAYQKKAKPWLAVLVIVGVLLLQLLPVAISLVTFNTAIEEALQQEKQNGYNDTTDFFLPEEDLDENNYGDTGTSILPNGVSVEEYEQLEVGMTYGEISYIIGGDAMQQNEMEDGSVLAIWPGEYDIAATVSIRFENGVAVEITENGLLS